MQKRRFQSWFSYIIFLTHSFYKYTIFCLTIDQDISSQSSLIDEDDSISKESINIQTITVDKTSESINHVESIPVPGNIPPLEKESIELPKNNKNDKSTLLFEKETIYKYIEDVNNLSSPNRISDKDTLSKITNNSSKDDSTNSIPVYTNTENDSLCENKKDNKVIENSFNSKILDNNTKDNTNLSINSIQVLSHRSQETEPKRTDNEIIDVDCETIHSKEAEVKLLDKINLSSCISNNKNTFIDEHLHNDCKLKPLKNKSDTFTILSASPSLTPTRLYSKCDDKGI
ncbi:hypothetical protein WA158_003265 [Blastocystis sp. Blastoise]